MMINEWVEVGLVGLGIVIAALVLAAIAACVLASRKDQEIGDVGELLRGLDPPRAGFELEPTTDPCGTMVRCTKCGDGLFVGNIAPADASRLGNEWMRGHDCDLITLQRYRGDGLGLKRVNPEEEKP